MQIGRAGVSSGLVVSALLTMVQCAMASDAVSGEHPPAPRVSCDITMHQWCIVQGDSALSMRDNGEQRIWSLSDRAGRGSLVIVRESRICSVHEDYLPTRISEMDGSSVGEVVQPVRKVRISLSRDRKCILEIEYPLGDSDVAREGQRLARYRFLVGDKPPFRTNLLDIE